ncbi:GNAT family N-acetyltransferase [Flagellimonas nanhaiensis]|uniref:GNAT family N-acetyltransferase n=1 Tax=Flagellimonas nanhaiensis TaxID=2292706 RepID=A0A371JSU4_9FLAO|nr:GNAT family N-acetyltransferase [Allomuricauda nanhaiensis]RDY60829.1 GNAT family N-acetyltransferase [Allomuricauda nanhaiensis]
MQIRRANNSDAATIALLGRFTFTETFGHLFGDQQDLLDYLDRTFNVEKLHNSIDKPNNLYWLAFVDNLPIGYAKLKLNSSSPFIESNNICQLQKIYVLKDFLSKKVGLTLQSKLLEKAQNLGYEEIWLSVLKENLRAIRFYEKNGFRIIGDHGFQIGKEHFNFQAMSKKLSLPL